MLSFLRSNEWATGCELSQSSSYVQVHRELRTQRRAPQQLLGRARRVEPCVPVVDCRDHLTGYQSMCRDRRGEATVNQSLASVLLAKFGRMPEVLAFDY